MGENMSAAEIMALARDNEGMFGGNGGGMFMMLILFLLLGGNGLGGLGGNNGAMNQVNNDFLYTQSKIDGLSAGLINQTNQINQTLNAGFNGVSMGLCNLGHQIDSGFCATNRNVDSVKTQMMQDKCDITNTIRDSVQGLMNAQQADKIDALRERLSVAQNAANNAAQTQDILSRLCPQPVPSYAVMNPNTPMVPLAGVPFGGYYGAPYGVPFGGHGCHKDPCGC